jgi:hypothetical protein
LLSGTDLVVRGTIRERAKGQDPAKEIWKVDVLDVLVSRSDLLVGETLLVEHVEPFRDAWSQEAEGIFFLFPVEPWPGNPTGVYATVLGDFGVVFEDLSSVASAIREVPAQSLPSSARPPTARFVVALELGTVIGGGSLHGWLYQDVAAKVLQLRETSIASQWSDELPVPSGDIVLRIDATEVVTKRALALLSFELRESREATSGVWVASGPLHEPDRMEELLAGFEAMPVELDVADLIDRYGALPFPEEKAALDSRLSAEESSLALLDTMAEPIAIQVDETTLVFSHWFFADLRKDGTVTALKDDIVLFEGPLFGPGALMNRKGNRIEIQNPEDGGAIAFEEALLHEEATRISEGLQKPLGNAAAELDRRAQERSQAVLKLIPNPIAVDLKDGTTVVFSHWFFSDLREDGTVRVIRNGETVVEGDMFGPSGLMRIGNDRVEIVSPARSVVASFESSLLRDAADRLIAQASP